MNARDAGSRGNGMQPAGRTWIRTCARAWLREFRRFFTRRDLRHDKRLRALVNAKRREAGFC